MVSDLLLSDRVDTDGLYGDSAVSSVLTVMTSSSELFTPSTYINGVDEIGKLGALSLAASGGKKVIESRKDEDDGSQVLVISCRGFCG